MRFRDQLSGSLTTDAQLGAHVSERATSHVFEELHVMVGILQGHPVLGALAFADLAPL